MLVQIIPFCGNEALSYDFDVNVEEQRNKYYFKKLVSDIQLELCFRDTVSVFMIENEEGEKTYILQLFKALNDWFKSRDFIIDFNVLPFDIESTFIENDYCAFRVLK